MLTRRPDTEPNLTSQVLPHDTHWAIEPTAGAQLWHGLKSESVSVHVAAFASAQSEAAAEKAEAAARVQRDDNAKSSARSDSEGERKPFDFQGGTAVFTLSGPMTKRPTSMSMGTSTVRLRQQIRAARKDADVKNALLLIDSPGGSVSGTGDLAADLALFAAVKPLSAYVEDCCCSAAYWCASQCTDISANPTAVVGSIGTIMVIEDSSRAAQNAGVEVLVFGSGKFKGAGADGTPVTPEQRAYFQQTIDALNSHFLAAVQRGRGLTEEEIDALTDARIHIGAEAVAMRLIDRIGTLDEVLDDLRSQQPASERGKGKQTMSFKDTIDHFTAGFKAGGGKVTPEEEAEAKTALTPATTPILITPSAAPPAVTFPQPDARVLEMQAKLDKIQQKARAARIEEFKAEGAILPAAEKAAAVLMSENEEAFTAFLELNGRVVAMAGEMPTSETARPASIRGEDAAAAADEKRDDNTLNNLALARMKRDGIPYSDALKQVARENAALVESINANLPVLG